MARKHPADSRDVAPHLTTHNGNDLLLTDGPPPPWCPAHPWAWAPVVCAAVVVLVVLGATAVAVVTTTKTTAMMDTGVPLQTALDDADDAAGGVGLLMTGTPLDVELRGASQLAARESSAGGVRLLVGAVAAAPEAVATAFTHLWRKGVRVFLAGGDAALTEEICRQLQQTGREALLVAPTADAASFSCGGILVSLAPPPAALLAAEVAALAQGGLARLIPVIARPVEGAPLLALLKAAATHHNMSVAPPVYLDAARPSLTRLQQVLAALPGAGVWLAADRHLPQLMALMKNALHDRLLMLHANPTHLASLLAHPVARAVAEACAATTVQWAGPFRLDTPSDRRLLASLSPSDPLAAALTYHAAALASRAAAKGGATNFTRLAASLLGEEAIWGAAPSQGHVRPKVAWAARLRLVERHLLGTLVMQDSPWLLEGFSRVEEEGAGSYWRVSTRHSPARLLAREEVWQLAEHAGCGALARIEVKAHDPLTHRPVLAAWPAHAAPDALLVPNASPRGFSVTATCHGHGGKEVEVACRGAAQHNDSLSCVAAAREGGRRRRDTDSFLIEHGLGYLISPNGKDTDPLIILRKVKGLFKHKDFRPFIPQIGGCLGSAAGCSFCFVFLLSRNVSVVPGVCMGSCAVGIGGACISLFAKGVEYKLNHVDYQLKATKFRPRETVICTELFKQGQLSWESYVADAAYGARLAAKDPQALRGYQLLAGPLVAAMQLSPALSDLVKTLAQPWISHMEYEEGMAVADDPLGRLITNLGLPLCSTVALLHDHILAVAGLLVFISALARYARHTHE